MKTKMMQILELVISVTLMVTMLIHGCNLLRRKHNYPSNLGHRKMLMNTSFSSLDVLKSTRIGNRSNSTTSVRSKARGDAFSDSVGDKIDPKYGMEKRLVPTGPNPLHH